MNLHRFAIVTVFGIGVMAAAVAHGASVAKSGPTTGGGTAAKSGVTNTSPIPLGPFLLTLESYGAKYKQADTKALKQKVRADARARGESFLKGKRMTIRGQIRDVRVISPTLTQLSFYKVDVRPFEAGKRDRKSTRLNSSHRT